MISRTEPGTVVGTVAITGGNAGWTLSLPAGIQDNDLFDVLGSDVICKAGVDYRAGKYLIRILADHSSYDQGVLNTSLQLDDSGVSFSIGANGGEPGSGLTLKNAPVGQATTSMTVEFSYHPEPVISEYFGTFEYTNLALNLFASSKNPWMPYDNSMIAIVLGSSGHNTATFASTITIRAFDIVGAANLSRVNYVVDTRRWYRFKFEYNGTTTTLHINGVLEATVTGNPLQFRLDGSGDSLITMGGHPQQLADLRVVRDGVQILPATGDTVELERGSGPILVPHGPVFYRMAKEGVKGINLSNSLRFEDLPVNGVGKVAASLYCKIFVPANAYTSDSSIGFFASDADPSSSPCLKLKFNAGGTLDILLLEGGGYGGGAPSLTLQATVSNAASTRFTPGAWHDMLFVWTPQAAPWDPPTRMIWLDEKNQFEGYLPIPAFELTFSGSRYKYLACDNPDMIFAALQLQVGTTDPVTYVRESFAVGPGAGTVTGTLTYGQES